MSCYVVLARFSLEGGVVAVSKVFPLAPPDSILALGGFLLLAFILAPRGNYDFGLKLPTSVLVLGEHKEDRQMKKKNEKEDVSWA